MLQFLFRVFWRIIIFFGGAAVIYFSATLTYKYADRQLNAFIAGLIVYCLLAYVIIPLLFRLYHTVFKHDHIPLYVTTSDGWASDPVNLAIVCKSKNELRLAMEKAGWYEADRLSFKNNLREVLTIIFNRAYPEAPVSRLFLFNRPHEIAFQIPTNPQLSPRTRHHIRFWRLEAPHDNKEDHNHFDFWQQKLFKWLHADKELWIGACTEEFRAIDLQWRTGRLTHAGSHESDKERDFIVETLQQQRLVKTVHMSEPGEKLRFRGQQFRTFYVSDGSIKIVTLK